MFYFSIKIVMRNINYFRNNEEVKEGWNFLKKIKASLAALFSAVVLTQQPANANSLSNSLKNPDKNYEFNLSKLPEVKSTYPAFLNVYGVGAKTKWWTYRGVWIKVHTDKFEWSVEKGWSYTKVAGIWVLWNEIYLKGGGSYVSLEDYEIGQYTINPKQLTWGLAVWYKNNNFKTEAWYIASRVYNIWNANTTAYVKYLELAYRTGLPVGQIDVYGTWYIKSAYGSDKKWLQVEGAYYPTGNVMISDSYDTTANYDPSNWEVSAGIKYTWGAGNGKLSPYFDIQKPTSSNNLVEGKYEENIANRPLKWNPYFENSIYPSTIKAEEINPQQFKQKVKSNFEKLNKLPEITIEANSTNIKVWESVTLTANASDPDGKVTSITWYDGNWNKIWTGKTVTITPNKEWKYTYYAVVTDNNGAIKKSNTITINVEALPTPTFNLNVSVEGWELISIDETDTSITITMTSSVNAVDYTFSITNWWYVEIEFPGHTDYVTLHNGESCSNDGTRDDSATWYVRYYDKNGNLLKEKSLKYVFE